MSGQVSVVSGVIDGNSASKSVALQLSGYAQVRKSKTGDALWAARSKQNPAEMYALDYVVERKSVHDLVHSIKGGRYEKQKYVLKRCGLRRVMYLIEGNPDVEVQGVRHCLTSCASKVALSTFCWLYNAIVCRNDMIL
jgi:crossover junction endonuclease MUS81